MDQYGLTGGPGRWQDVERRWRGQAMRRTCLPSAVAHGLQEGLTYVDQSLTGPYSPMQWVFELPVVINGWMSVPVESRTAQICPPPDRLSWQDDSNTQRPRRAAVCGAPGGSTRPPQQWSGLFHYHPAGFGLAWRVLVCHAAADRTQVGEVQVPWLAMGAVHTQYRTEGQRGQR